MQKNQRFKQRGIAGIQFVTAGLRKTTAQNRRTIMDHLLLTGMQFYAYHGVNAQENKVGNTFFVDLTIEGDFSAACHSDNIADAINYASVYEVVDQTMKVPCKLLEHLAENICRQLKDSFPQLISVEIKLTKINPPLIGQMESASIILVR